MCVCVCACGLGLLDEVETSLNSRHRIFTGDRHVHYGRGGSILPLSVSVSLLFAACEVRVTF